MEEQYWAAADNTSMFTTMTCTTDISRAAKVTLVWNPTYNGVAFKNSTTGKYINDLCNNGTRFNWWKASNDALTGDSYSTFDLTMITTSDPTTGINNMAAHEVFGTVYYTLSGTKLNSCPQQDGIYIRVQNGKSQKVVVKRNH